MTQAPADYDVIIIGGGLVGLTLANLLLPSSLKVAILENKHTPLPPYNPSHYDSRVSAINRASENIFRHIQVWEKIKQTRISSYQKMRIWEAGSPKEIRFDAAQINEPNLGHIIENQVILSALESRLQDYPQNATRFPHFQATDIHLSAEQGYIQDAKGRKLTFQLAVGADGKTSWLRNKLKMPLQEKDYHHTAIITHVRTTQPHHHTAYQRFLPTGPLAFLPLADPHLCSIVWSTSPAQAQALTTLTKIEFEQQLFDASEQVLGKLETIAPLCLFPLHYQHAQHYTQKRIALIGDAAHTVHPLAGLGLNLGLLDAACLAENLLRAHTQQRDIGLEKTLKRYERQQKAYNTVSLTLINALKILFTHPSAPLQHLKNIGIGFINQTPFIKNRLAQYALGTLGDIPLAAHQKV